MNTIVEKAKKLAIKAHHGLVRPNKEQQPYSYHLGEVVDFVIKSGGSNEEIAAAWLHDAVEDTSITLEDIHRECGEAVARIVDGLTDKPDLYEMPIAERKRTQAERVRIKSESVKRVKIADQTSNVLSVAIDPPVIWSHQDSLDYVNGALEIVEECKEASDFLYHEFMKAHAMAVAKHSQSEAMK